MTDEQAKWTLRNLHRLEDETEAGGRVSGRDGLHALARITRERMARYESAPMPPEAQRQRDWMNGLADMVDTQANAASQADALGVASMIERQRKASRTASDNASQTRKPELGEAIKKLAREPGTAKELFDKLQGMMDAYSEESYDDDGVVMYYLDDAGTEHSLTRKTFANRLSEERKKKKSR